MNEETKKMLDDLLEAVEKVERLMGEFTTKHMDSFEDDADVLFDFLNAIRDGEYDNPDEAYREYLHILQE